jgi:hypothetical protein
MGEPLAGAVPLGMGAFFAINIGAVSTIAFTLLYFFIGQKNVVRALVLREVLRYWRSLETAVL